MANDNKGIILLGGLVAVVGAAYLYFKNACATPLAPGATWPPASICALSLFAPNTAASAPPPAPPTMTAALCAAANGSWNATTGICTPATGSGSTSGSTSPGTITPPTVDPWANAIALMKQNQGSDSANFDTWAYQFQYQPRPASPALPTGYGNNSYISPAVMAAIIAAGGGDRTQMISAETFVGYLKTALAAAGLSGYEIPMWMIHRAVS